MQSFLIFFSYCFRTTTIWKDYCYFLNLHLLALFTFDLTVFYLFTLYPHVSSYIITAVNPQPSTKSSNSRSGNPAGTVLLRYFFNLCCELLIFMKADFSFLQYSLICMLFQYSCASTALSQVCPFCIGILENSHEGAFVWEYSGIRMYSGIYSGYSAPGSRIARMNSRYSGMRIAPKQTLTRMIPIILIPDWSQTNAPWESTRADWLKIVFV